MDILYHIMALKMTSVNKVVFSRLKQRQRENFQFTYQGCGFSLDILISRHTKVWVSSLLTKNCQRLGFVSVISCPRLVVCPEQTCVVMAGEIDIVSLSLLITLKR